MHPNGENRLNGDPTQSVKKYVDGSFSIRKLRFLLMQIFSVQHGLHKAPPIKSIIHKHLHVLSADDIGDRIFKEPPMFKNYRERHISYDLVS